MKRFRNFLSGQLFKVGKEIRIPNTLSSSAKTYGLAILYLAMAQIGLMFCPMSFLTTQEFYQDYNFLARLGYVFVSFKLALYKFFLVWLFAEAGCIASGIAFEGYDEKANPKFGLKNIDPRLLETSTSLNDWINGFNINTNSWTKYYMFKRFAFLGNKHVSSILSLFFLALWQ
jgi:lysophospholipid acyltransferase 5